MMFKRFADFRFVSFEAYTETGATGGAGARPAPGRQRPDQERASDQAAEALAQMMAQMFVLRGTAGSAGPPQLLSAAAEGNLGQVKRILHDQPDLVRSKAYYLSPVTRNLSSEFATR